MGVVLTREPRLHTPGVTESGDRILEPLDLQRAAGGRERGLRVLPGFMIQSPTLRDAMTLRHARLACCLKADGRIRADRSSQFARNTARYNRDASGDSSIGLLVLCGY